MPQGTRVARCVRKLEKRYPKGVAIAICQTSTRQSYRTGKKLLKKRDASKKKNHHLSKK